MKIVAGIQTFEEEDFIRETLTSLYDWCEKLIVVEGSWKSGLKFSNSKRSRDKTIEYIKKFPDPERKILYHEYNGLDQEDHRRFILNRVCEHSPDWYIKADADEIIHNNQVKRLIDILKNSPFNCLSVTHRLFWNDLFHYEHWGPVVRFLKIKGLKREDLTLTSEGGSLNHSRKEGYFQSAAIPVDQVEFYHPSYCKNTLRQKLKWDYRSIDDKKPFPHLIHENGFLTRPNPQEWIPTLKTCSLDSLPACLRDHPRALPSQLWGSFE